MRFIFPILPFFVAVPCHSSKVVSLATYFVTSTLAFTAAAAAVSRAPMRLHIHASLHCAMDAAASTTALEQKISKRSAANSAAATAARNSHTGGAATDRNDNEDNSDNEDKEFDNVFNMRDSVSDRLDPEDNEVDAVAQDILMRPRSGGLSCCAGLTTADFGVPRMTDRFQKFSPLSPLVAILAKLLPSGESRGRGYSKHGLSGNAQQPQGQVVAPRPLVCLWQKFCSDGNMLASTIFVALTLLFGGVTRLLGQLGDHRSGYEHDPYFLVEQWVRVGCGMKQDGGEELAWSGSLRNTPWGGLLACG